MPNWVTNKITLLGKDKENKEILTFIKGKERKAFIDFGKIIPMPDYISKKKLSTEEFLVNKKIRKNNWYDWSIENWGTKWNANTIAINLKMVLFLIQRGTALFRYLKD